VEGDTSPKPADGGDFEKHGDEAFQNEVKAEERRRRVEPEVPELKYQYALFELEEVSNTSKGVASLQSFIDMMKEQRYEEARKAYKKADGNLPFGDLVTVTGMNHQYFTLRDAANYFLDQGVRRNIPNLNLGYMGFGHRNEYAFHRMKHHEQRKAIIKELEGGASLTSDEIQEKMNTGHKDVRSTCDKAQDVAEIYAEAFYWDKAIGLMNDPACPRSVAHKAALIGAFAIGVPARMNVNTKETIQKVIDYGMELKEHRRTNTEYQAAMVTLHLHIRRKIFALEPEINEDPNVVMILYYPSLYGQLAQIETEKLSEALDKSTLVYIHFISIIKEAVSMPIIPTLVCFTNTTRRRAIHG
jgi:hypothetical protein